MAIPAYLCAHLLGSLVEGRVGQALALIGGAVTGAVVFGVTQLVLRSPELTWLTAGIRDRRTPAVATREAG
jgi:hypothetical protein